MLNNNSPAAEIRSAAKLMRKRAEAATPGPWERPLDVRHKNLVGATLPDDEAPRSWKDGIIPGYMNRGYLGRYRGQRERVEVVQCNTWSDGTHSRKRNGRDLEYIAGMHPGVALAVADWLDSRAYDAEDARDANGSWDLSYCDSPGGIEAALKVARAYLGVPDA